MYEKTYTNTTLPRLDRGIHSSQNELMDYYIYIISNKRNGTLYIGMTPNLIKRVWQHKNKVVKSFTQKYNLTMLVYYEQQADAWHAKQREKRLKEWKRQWKIELIESMNPEWKDLYENIL